MYKKSPTVYFASQGQYPAINFENDSGNREYADA